MTRRIIEGKVLNPMDECNSEGCRDCDFCSEHDECPRYQRNFEDADMQSGKPRETAKAKVKVVSIEERKPRYVEPDWFDDIEYME